MHVVTKILVVFCAILSLLLAALTIAYTANADRVRADWKNQQAAAIAATAGAKNEVAEFAQQRVTMQTRIESLLNDLAGRTSDVADLQSQRTTLRSELERAQNEVAAIRNQIAQLSATTGTQATTLGNLTKEVTDLRDGLVSASKREIDLIDRISDLTSANEVLEQNSRALKEQLEETKVALQRAQQGYTTAAAAAVPRELPGPIIQARVQEVFKAQNGDEMVVISEGANRGIKENTLMNITRGGSTFVAAIVITTVEPQRAVGKVTLYGSAGGGVQAQDLVLSRLN